MTEAYKINKYSKTILCFEIGFHLFQVESTIPYQCFQCSGLVMEALWGVQGSSLKALPYNFL